MEKENYYIITIVENGEEKTIERQETEQEFRKRIKAYRKNNIKIKGVVMKVITTTLVQVNY